MSARSDDLFDVDRLRRAWSHADAEVAEAPGAPGAGRPVVAPPSPPLVQLLDAAREAALALAGGPQPAVVRMFDRAAELVAAQTGAGGGPELEGDDLAANRAELGLLLERIEDLLEALDARQRGP